VPCFERQYRHVGVVSWLQTVNPAVLKASRFGRRCARGMGERKQLITSTHPHRRARSRFLTSLSSSDPLDGGKLGQYHLNSLHCLPGIRLSIHEREAFGDPLSLDGIVLEVQFGGVVDHTLIQFEGVA